MTRKRTWSRAVVTGAASGIGRCFARTLAAQGTALGMIDIAKDALGEIETEIRERGGAANSRVGDVSDGAAIAAAFEALDRKLGGIDLVVHCAGILRSGLFVDQPADEFERVTQVNLFGTANVVRACVSSLRTSGGAIACLASTAALHGWPEMSAYSTAKFGVAGFCDAVRPELERDGVGVTTVFPLLIDTPLLSQPDIAPILAAGKAIPAQVVVDKTLAGLRRGKSRVYVPGTVRIVAALQGIAPSLLDVYARRFTN
jgi:short-subunit dehydrogenase